MTALTQSRIEIELTLKSEIEQIREDENAFHVGAVSISKKHPTFSVGFAHPMVPETHFTTQWFEVGERRGWAIILHSGGNPPDYFAGWVGPEDEGRAAFWVDKLNVEIQQRVAPLIKERAANYRDQTTLDSNVLECHLGDEWAPDAPWGEDIIRLTRDGTVEYHRRQRGELKQHARGQLDPARFSSLMSALSETKFPEPPQRFFPPGASVATLSTEPPPRRVLVHVHAGLRLHGYGEVLSALNALCAAFRDAKQEELARWSFVPAE